MFLDNDTYICYNINIDREGGKTAVSIRVIDF